MQQSNFPTNLRRSGYLTRRNNGISWKLSGEIRAGYLGVLVRYAGLERLRWVRKNEYGDGTRWPYAVPLYMEL